MGEIGGGCIARECGEMTLGPREMTTVLLTRGRGQFQVHGSMKYENFLITRPERVTVTWFVKKADSLSGTTSN